MPVIIDGTTGITTPGLTNSGTDTLSSGTANGVAYLNGSKVLTTGSALVFDGSNLGIGTSSPVAPLHVAGSISDTVNASGVFAGVINNYGNIKLTGSNGGYIDFSDASTNYKGRILYTNSDNAMSFRTNGSEKMRIDASGNLGLGVTPNAWLSTAKAIDIGANSAFFNASNNASVGNNVFLNTSSQWIYKNTAAAALYQQVTGQHIWYNAPSGTAGNAITWTQAMTLDASGNFYVGTTSQVGGSNITFYQPNNADLKIAGAVSTATRAVYQVFVNTAVTTVGTENSTGGSLASGTAAYATVLANNGAYPICFATNNTERGRFTSAGEFWVAGTTDQGAYNIQCNGTGVWGAGAYVNGSDARIKDDIKPLPSSLSVVQNLNPVTFRYKESWSKDTSVQPGFIAQELQQALAGQEYIDGVVMQGPEYMSVAYQTLIPVLTKAIQEQQALIEQLTTRIAALEAK